jgi:ribosomal-protein-alanine N-acetyltransferase
MKLPSKDLFVFEKPGFENIQKIVDLAFECDLSQWTTNDFQEELKRSDSRQIMVTINKTLIGFTVLRLINPLLSNGAIAITKFEEAEILFIAIAPNFRHRNIGSKLLERLLKEVAYFEVRTVWLEVRESNKNAIHFYKNNNFFYQYSRQNYFQRPLDNAWIMKKELR